MAYEEVMFEVTRECNLKCDHCMRGESQKITMSREIIDKVVPQILISKQISLTGGEPMLVPDTINYLVDSIIKNKTIIAAFTSVVNGTILDDRAIKTIEAFNRIGEYIYNTVYYKKYKSNNIELPEFEIFKNDPENESTVIAAISISVDEFHKNDVQKALDFYRKYANKYVTIDTQDNWEKKNEEGKTVNLKEYIKRIKEKYKELKYPWVDNTGRAKQNNIGLLETEYSSNDDMLLSNHCCNLCHRVEMKDGFIMCHMEITANGYLCLAKQSSYDYKDNYYICDVLKESMLPAIFRWQWKEPLLCRELHILLDCETKLKHDKNLPNEEQKIMKLAIEFLMKKRDGIKRIHVMYPNMPYEDAVKGVNAELNIYTEGAFTKVLSNFLPDYDKNYVYNRAIEQNICNRLMSSYNNTYNNNDYGRLLNVLDLLNTFI